MLHSGGFFGNPNPHIDAHDTTARNRVNSVKSQIELVERKLEKLKLVNQAMWELITERTVLEETDIIEKVKEIDARDGVMDGRNRVEASVCVKCQRTIRKGDSKCMYCGAEKEMGSIFDWIR